MVEKRILRDSIHNFISFEKNGLINRLIDTPEFQRLKDIRQLGVSYFTYPSAVHTRFSHSLGTYHLSERAIYSMNFEPEYQDEFKISALLHDIGHGPFSHMLEKQFFQEKEHKDLTSEIIESGDLQISEILSDNGIEPKKISEMILMDTDPTYLHLMISSQLDVDRFDYLLRDAWMTGNPHGNFDLERILHTIKLNPDKNIFVSNKGWPAVENYLFCRYQMYKQVYYHHHTVSIEELVKKILLRASEINEFKEILPLPLKELLNGSENINHFIDTSDSDILSLIRMGKFSEDQILKDLSLRFLHRKPLKTIELKGNEVTKILNKEEEIKGIIEKNDFNPKYYHNIVNISEKKAYKPYSPVIRDKEEAIYSNPDHTRNISDEIDSIREIKTPLVVYIFTPNDEIREMVSEVVR